MQGEESERDENFLEMTSGLTLEWRVGVAGIKEERGTQKRRLRSHPRTASLKLGGPSLANYVMSLVTITPLGGYEDNFKNEVLYVGQPSGFSVPVAFICLFFPSGHF